jgi:gliding motility-associated-like protein
MIRFIYIVAFFCFSQIGFSQGLCNSPSGSVAGGFNLSANSICAGQSVTITDLSGGTSVQYVYDYRGESLANLSLIGATPNKTNAFVLAGTYKILQYGTKNGQQMYACKTIVVRDDNKPVFSYTPCNNNTIQIIIPAGNPENDFDSYRIDWGDGSPIEIVNQLTSTDYSKSKSLSLPRTIKVEGVYNSGLNCASPSAINIPVLIPAAFPSGYNLPNYPNISKLELSSAQSADLTINGSFEGNGYSLYMTERGQPYSATPLKTGVKPGIQTIALPDSTKSYCFYIQKPNLCGIEQSAEICTIVLNEVRPVNKTNEIYWASDYPTFMNLPGFNTNPAFGRFMNRTSKIVKKEGTNTPTKIPTNGNFYFDGPIDCAKKYCYRIETTTQGQIYYNAFSGVSLSKEICVDRKTFTPPAITDTRVSILNNKIDINYTDNSTWTLQKTKFELFKETNGTFSSINTATASVANPNPKLKDDLSDPNQQSFCYKLGYTDECGSSSLLSPPFCSVFLKENPANSLLWTSQSPFGNGTITKYELIPYDENTGSPLAAIALSLNPTTHTPDLSNFINEAPFSIQTTSSTGKIVNSNIITILIKPTVLLPEAFSPNGDGDNDIFKVFGKLPRISTFQMSIYNRWGNEVFNTTDILTLWDGNVSNTEAPPGMYYYKLYSKFINGFEFSKRGSVILLR